MDRRTMQYGTPRTRRANPVMVLELGDVELVEETLHRGARGHLFPAAISDGELSRLVDECTSELCALGAYRYSAHAG